MKDTKYMTKKLSFYHLIEASQINSGDIDLICNLAKEYALASEQGVLPRKDQEGQILASLFFEASTRTRFSFETAMMRLGGKVTSLEQGQSSSAKKGESLNDMGRIISSYANIVVMRHPEAGSVAELAKYSTVPVINAGDGANHHPTQSLVDIYTILDEKKRLSNLTIGILGDLKYGRTVSSLLTLLSYYPNNRFVLISHPQLKYGSKKVQMIKDLGCDVIETDNLQTYMADLDVLYVTRIQKERFSDLKQYEQVKDNYRITKDSIKRAKQEIIIMHPLPRVNEIDPELDDLPCAKYFKQASNGLFVRMALLDLMI